MAHAVVYDEFGGPEVLHLIEVAVPAPTAGQVAVAVTAAGVNPIDIKLRAGMRASKPITSARRTGSDAAGTITAVGDGVDGFRVGDDVVIFGGHGMYATDVVVGVEHVHHRPPQVSAAAGAALGIPVGTAYQSLRSLAVREDDTLLIHGGSGAVGQAAIQFAALWGANVVATASPRRFDRVSELGATPVAYGPGLEERVRAAAPGGVSVVFDAAGTDEALEVSLAVATDPQRVATIVRGADAAGIGIRAFSGGSPTPLTEQQLAWRAEALPVTLALMAAGHFSVELAASFALSEAARAQQLVSDGADGKVTLSP
ncbi:NADPH:quinone reductase-like Zn-dependent oxidoreductase [Microbacterium endophyticum]|uniref:NADPH:quinone reductase-like Zn-dependent oxidoreductase n=1 Tax=Microbacterium endophyticum TaxID=1526412 RepID=A0A7W4YLW4_9MICO|nr:NADP-dependent oxidoreductase [Microbacterium endophyticum]MBB2974904.1 NADPH:quinone reductase-like Zn-dependent oxidoreductase [Microbacterium endophyticum]NIK37201.1 NADPH:quinone reductase-like Zn-dependent oxidoreductase [Microbacterium endophyticum]